MAPRRIDDALSETIDTLRQASIDEARLKAEWLVVEAAGIPRLELALHGSDLLDDAADERLRDWAERMAMHEPLQYVLGYTSFLGYRIQTDRRALIPRPETEQLTELVLKELLFVPSNGPIVVDVGTGSGCIAVAVALQRPAATVWAIDSSKAALELAELNVRNHDLDGRVHLAHGDLLEGCPSSLRIDLVVSNPPYVSPADFERLDPGIRCWEPAEALRAAEDGLGVFRRLIPSAHRRLRPGGALFLEIGEEQSGPVRALMGDAGYRDTAVHLDLAGRPRIVEGRKDDPGRIHDVEPKRLDAPPTP